MTQQPGRSTDDRGELGSVVNGVFVGAGSLFLATSSIAVTVLVTVMTVVAVVLVLRSRGRG
jgi:hypothetical protein